MSEQKHPRRPAGESEQATPPRGVPRPVDQPSTPYDRLVAPLLPPGAVAGADEAPVRAGRRRTVVLAVALVVGLLGVTWVSTDWARTVWAQASPTQAVTADADGVARHGGLEVSIRSVVDLGADPQLPGSSYTPPAGYRLWQVGLQTTATSQTPYTCKVSLVDAEGRRYVTNMFVDSFADGYEFSYRCSRPEPDEDVPPVQQLLALVPEGVTPVAVYVEEPISLAPVYLRLDVD